MNKRYILIMDTSLERLFQTIQRRKQEGWVEENFDVTRDYFVQSMSRE